MTTKTESWYFFSIIQKRNKSKSGEGREIKIKRLSFYFYFIFILIFHKRIYKSLSSIYIHMNVSFIKQNMVKLFNYIENTCLDYNTCLQLQYTKFIYNKIHKITTFLYLYNRFFFFFLIF